TRVPTRCCGGTRHRRRAAGGRHLRWLAMSADPMATLAALEGVPSAFAAARDGVDALLRDRGLRRTPPEFTTESLLRGAIASGLLEGAASTEEQIRAGE